MNRQQRIARLRERLAIAVAALVVEEEIGARQRRQRRWWVKPWIQRRPLYGQYETLLQELRLEHPGDFKAYLRMEPDMFQELCARVGPRIQMSQDGRPPLSSGMKLAITLRFLATGNSYRSLAFDFRVAHNTISQFVPYVCRAIVEEYKDEVFRTPSTPEEWREVETAFRERWNYPHCCGAIDGKHVGIRKPKDSGSLYFNYKGFFSIVLLAVADAQYKFLWAQVGSPGSNSDCGIFNDSQLSQALESGTIGFPEPDPLPHDDMNVPYFLVGDDAFPLRTYMMKPYSNRYLTVDERIHNYRTSRGRRVVENAFGILAMRFRCLLVTLSVVPENAILITKGCLVLHNLMRIRFPNLQNVDADQEDDDHRLIPGEWRNHAVMQELGEEGRGPRATAAAKEQRSLLKHYFMSDAGSVPWQMRAINR